MKPILLLSSLACLLAGCTSEDYRVETRLLPDGQVDRAIYQPWSETAKAVREDRRWQETRPVKDTNAGTPIRELPRAKPDPDEPAKVGGSYFAAWGRFASPQKLPDHYVRSVEGLDRQGRLVREYSRRDLGLIVEHDWTETLSDVVVLSDMRRTRRKLIRLFSDLAIATFERRFGKRQDFRSLDKWMQAGMADFIEDLHDYAVELSLTRPRKEREISEEMVIKILAQYGLRVAAADGKLMKKIPRDATEKTFLPFARRLLARHIRDPSGKPPGEEMVNEILVWLDLLEKPDEVAAPGEDELDEKEKSPLEEAWEAMVIKRFGSEDAYRLRVEEMSARVFGVHQTPYPLEIFGTSRDFDMELEVPGLIVETNGVLESDRRVRWEFNATEAYPLGYAMRCRSLEIPAAARKLLADARPLASRTARQRLLGMVSNDDDLVRLLKKCVAGTSWRPLESYRERLVRKKKADELKQLDGLYRLLALPLSGSGGTGT